MQSAPTRVRGNLCPDEQKEQRILRTFCAHPAHRSACFSPWWVAVNKEEKSRTFPLGTVMLPAEDPTHRNFLLCWRRPLRAEQIPPEKCHSNLPPCNSLRALPKVEKTVICHPATFRPLFPVRPSSASSDFTRYSLVIKVVIRRASTEGWAWWLRKPVDKRK
jgi:hypothetical protein